MFGKLIPFVEMSNKNLISNKKLEDVAMLALAAPFRPLGPAGGWPLTPVPPPCHRPPSLGPCYSSCISFLWNCCDSSPVGLLSCSHCFSRAAAEPFTAGAACRLRHSPVPGHLAGPGHLSAAIPLEPHKEAQASQT